MIPRALFLTLLTLGDKDGRMLSRVKAAEVMANCTMCMMPIRMTKTNTEARSHTDSKHVNIPFPQCFPGQFDPTAPVAAVAKVAATAAAPKKAKASSDLSFLDASLSTGGKKK
jgi:hypothetical protein